MAKHMSIRNSKQTRILWVELCYPLGDNRDEGDLKISMSVSNLPQLTCWKVFLTNFVVWEHYKERTNQADIVWINQTSWFGLCLASNPICRSWINFACVVVFIRYTKHYQCWDCSRMLSNNITFHYKIQRGCVSVNKTMGFYYSVFVLFLWQYD